jgi:dipeptidyl aminopeptidase/acylaminoacyl peptidase
MRRLVLPILLLIALPLTAQQPTSALLTRSAQERMAETPTPAGQSSFELTIQNIMRGPEHYGREPSRIRWTPDGQWIYFMWNEAGTPWNQPLRNYRVRARAGATPEQVTTAHMDSVGPLLEGGVLSQDRRYRAVSHGGDIYVVDLRTNTSRRITQTLEEEINPQFAPDARTVYFVRNNNVFSVNLTTGLVAQLTDIRSTPAPRDPPQPTGMRGLLEAQQLDLFEAVRERAERDSIMRAERMARDSARIQPLHLREGERVTSLSVSPDGRGVLIGTSIPARDAQRTRVPAFVTRSGFTEELTVRTKVGDALDAGRIAFMSLPSGDVRFLQVTPGDTTRPPSFAFPIGWNQDGRYGLLYAVSADYKTRYLHRVSSGGELLTLDVLRDTAWIGGPCSNCAGWYDNGRRAWFVSEATGYAHLYTVAADGSDRRQLTSGDWEVLSVQLSQDGRTFYMETYEVSPFERHLFRMSVNGGARTRITRDAGGHQTTLSPNERMIASVFSTANTPWELYVMPNQPNASMSRLTLGTTEAFRSHPWLEPEIVMVPASDGIQVPARIYRPREVGAQPNGAAVIFVHGAGYLHNVHDWWSQYAREYMFHHFLASRGYVVLDMDFRASAGYGRDWRTAIYRHMGGRDLQDHVDGSRYLQQEYGIPPERIGIYGGSYGGFITLMALMTEPESFGAGAALRSVTDWAHYNHPYTARILNTPDDTVAYRRSSPIYFAEGLARPLLITHGMVDVNVHFQDVVRLAQRLIELGKTDWEMAVYPVEDHAFVRPDSWADQYRRIFELFENNLHPAQRAGRGVETGSR